MSTPGWLLPFEWLDVYFLRPLGRFLKAEYTGFLLIPAVMIIFVLWEQYGNAAEDMGRICAEIESMRENPAVQNPHKEAYRIQKICSDY